MILDIGDIRSVPNQAKTFDLEGRVDSTTPVHIWGTVRQVDHIIYLEAQADVKITLSCDRCLETFDRDYHLDINDLFYPEGQKVDDIDFYKTYNGNQLQLDTVIKNHILLKMGMQKICRPDCKGICPSCGKNLNQGPCSCKTETIDPRLELLKNLKFEE